MRIINFKAENVKRLSAVEITPKGDVIEITGRNAQGKTSVLDAIYWALGGTEGVTAEPIRRGEDRAIIQLNLGKYVVTRKFRKTEDGKTTTSLTVETAEGAAYKSPQSILDDIVGSLAFDPLEFTRMKPREQFDAVRAFVPGVDFAKLDTEDKHDFEGRASVNRQLKQAQAEQQATTVPTDLPEPSDTEALELELAEVGTYNAAIEREADARQRRQVVLAALRDQAKQAEREAERLEAQARIERAKVKDRLEKADAEAVALDALPPLAERKDPAEVQARLRAGREANKLLDRAAELKGKRDALDYRVKQLAMQSDQLTRFMDERRAEREKAIAAAKMPVEGLGFGDGVITFNGLPLDQASDAERLRVSVAMAMAMNPMLRVIRVRDGSLLDTESMATLAEMAKQADCQVWIETVASGRAGAIVIEDGHIVQ